jgi:signal transduction histidine kinase
MRSGTLSIRLFLLMSAWALLCVALIALVLTEAYRRNAERRFSDLVAANLYNLMGSVEPGPNGRLAGNPELGDPRYRAFGSGFYWSVESVADPVNRMTSTSLGGGAIEVPRDLPRDANHERRFAYTDASGQTLSAIEAEIFLGEGNDLYSFRVTGNVGELAAEIAAFRRVLVLLLAVSGVGFAAASYLVVRIGLGPIKEATRRLADIRDGRAERIEGRFPDEIQPLIDETNALIAANRSVIERARTQVGNLAHSLKTPIAVLRNDAATAPRRLRAVIEEQTRLMGRQVQAYLDRARIAARVETVSARAPARPVLERLVRVIGRLNPSLEIALDAPQDAVFALEQQDLEEVAGNLLENAAKFARKRIALFVRPGTAPATLELTVEDDGRGMTSAQCEAALKRGVRLDEAAPGSGLGLSIVRDIASEYRGSMTLGRATMGGLRASVTLPAR